MRKKKSIRKKGRETFMMQMRRICFYLSSRKKITKIAIPFFFFFMVKTKLRIE